MDPVHSERPDATGQPRGIRVSNAFSAQLDLQSGISVQLSATAAATSDTRFEVDILGSAGEAHFSLTNKLQIGRAGAPLSGVPVSGVSDAERTNAVPFFKGSFDYYAEAIVQSILSSDDSFVDAAATVESAVATQEVLDAMLISTRAGTRVEVASGYTSSTDV
jgi:predicted dehydrogenase